VASQETSEDVEIEFVSPAADNMKSLAMSVKKT